jgi:hypothetical protein
MMEGPVDLDALAAKGRQPQAPPNLALAPTLDQPHRPQLVPQYTIPPDARQLQEESQWVTLRNFHPAQTHIMIDRYNNQHALQPTQSKRIEMTVSQIAAHREKTRPDRGYFMTGHFYGQPLPLHPVRFVDVDDLPSARNDVPPPMAVMDPVAAAAAAVARRG